MKKTQKNSLVDLCNEINQQWNDEVDRYIAAVMERLGRVERTPTTKTDRSGFAGTQRMGRMERFGGQNARNNDDDVDNNVQCGGGSS